MQVQKRLRRNDYSLQEIVRDETLLKTIHDYELDPSTTKNNIKITHKIECSLRIRCQECLNLNFVTVDNYDYVEGSSL